MPPSPAPGPRHPHTQTYPEPIATAADNAPTVPAGTMPMPGRWAPAVPPAPPPDAYVPLPVPVAPGVYNYPQRQPGPPQRQPQRQAQRQPQGHRQRNPQQQMQPQPSQPQRTRGNKWAVASLLCAIMCFGVLSAPVVSPLGVLFGHLGRRAVKRYTDVGSKGMATVSLWINYIFLGLSAVAFFGLIVLGLLLGFGLG